MIKLNDDLLRELGLDTLPLEEKKRMLAHIYETLEMRVGMKLAQQMTDEQLDEFEQFIKNNDEAGALQWLETKFPHYKDVVSAEFESLKLEIRQVAPQILATAAQSQASAAVPSSAFPQMPPQALPGQWPQAPMPPMPQPQQPWPAQNQPPFGPQPMQPQPNNGFNVGYGAPHPQNPAPPQPYPTTLPPAAPWPGQQNQQQPPMAA